MSSVSAPRFYVLSAAQIASRRSPFLSDSFIYNYTTKELRFGPGPWSSCRVLLQAGEGSAENELTADQLAAVVGANAPNASNVFATMDDVPTMANEIGVVPYFRATISGVEHTYVQAGIANGKPYYTQVGAAEPLNEMIFWYEESANTGYWSLLVIGNPVGQESPSANTAQPALVANWVGSVIPVIGPLISNVDQALRSMPSITMNGQPQGGLLTFTGLTDGSGYMVVDLTALPGPIESAQFQHGASTTETPCWVVPSSAVLNSFTVRALDTKFTPISAKDIVFTICVRYAQ